MSDFLNRVSRRMVELNTALVLGIDPHPEDLDAPTAEAALEWSLELFQATRDHVVAVKPNAAFFEALPGGMDALAALIEAIDLPVLLDVKRGDIGSTARAQATACYDLLGADAVTAQPWLGSDAVEPFLRPNTAVFVLCHTSNPSAADVQRLPGLEGPSYLTIARVALSWSDAIGLVVGATAPDALAAIRSAHPDAWMLAPGVGAQGADAARTMKAGSRADGLGLLVPISRGISRANTPREAAVEWSRKLALVKGQAAPDPLLQGLIALDCIRFGSFTLRSGATSSVYVDCRRLIGDPRLLASLAARMVDAIDGAHSIAAVPTAGMPLGTALSLVANRPMIYPRMAVKAHGTGRTVEGIWESGQRVVLVDDVATRGTSLLEAAAVLRQEGLVVDRALVLVDRGAGAKEILAEEGVELRALFSLDDLLAAAPQA